MGCCLSTKDHRHHDMDSIGGAPPTSPPPVLDVETVKEVLLETPAAVVPNPGDRMSPENQDWKVAAGPPPPTAAIRGGSDPQGKSDDEEIVSEVSELYSYSESYSNATATQDKKLDGGDEDEDGVVNQNPPARARRGGAGGRGRGKGRSGERVVSRRTAAPSPEKRGQVAPLRSVRGRSTAGQPRNGAAEENSKRREAGDESRRRSMSPAPRRDEKSAAAAAGKTTIDPPNDVVRAGEGESLENPVVSLECFIFL